EGQDCRDDPAGSRQLSLVAGVLLKMTPASGDPGVAACSSTPQPITSCTASFRGGYQNATTWAWVSSENGRSRSPGARRRYPSAQAAKPPHTVARGRACGPSGLPPLGPD